MKNEINRECKLVERIDILALQIKKSKDMVGKDREKGKIKKKKR